MQVSHVYPQDGDIKKIYDTVVLYAPNNVTVSNIRCDGDKELIVCIENKRHQKIDLQIIVHPSYDQAYDDHYISTSVGVCFSDANCFARDFWAVDWCMLAPYNLIIC